MIETLFSQEGMLSIIFLIIVSTTLIGAFITCIATSLIRSLAGFALCSTGIAGLYYFLNSPFVSMMQILIYVGAVAITISFGIMLAKPEGSSGPHSIRPLAGPIGFGVSGLLAGGLMYIATSTDWSTVAQTKTATGSIRSIGMELLTTYSLVFEVVSVLLLAAIIGALVLAKEGR